MNAHTYRLTRLDLALVGLIMVFRNRLVLCLWLGLSVAFAAILSAAIFALAVLNAPEPPSIVVMVGTFLEYVAVYYVGFVVVTAFLVLIRPYTSLQRGVVGEHTLILTDTGLIEKTAYNNTHHPWMSLTRVLRSQRFVLIYITKTRAHAVPVRSFGSEAELERFVGEIMYRSVL